MNDYEPVAFVKVPHSRYRCPCGNSVIVAGWEYRGVICGECGSLMEWDTDLYDPRDADL